MTSDEQPGVGREADAQGSTASGNAAPDPPPAPSHLPYPGTTPYPKRAHGRSLGDFRIDGATTPHGLHPAEEKLLAAVARGEDCRLDSVRPSEAASANRIRAGFLRFLALGGDGEAPVHEKGIWLAGAFIEGTLDFEGCRDIVPQALSKCWCDGEIIVRDAHLRSLNLEGSRVPVLQGDGVGVGADVFLSNGFVAEGPVRVVGADIGGDFICSGGKFHNHTDDGNSVALSFDRAKVGGSVFLNGEFVAEGTVRLRGAKIAGDIVCSAAKLHNRTDDGNGVALSGDRAEVGGSVFLDDGFVAEGGVRFAGAEIGGQLACSGGRFRNRTNNGQGAALSCDRATVSDSVFLNDSFGAEGEVRFVGAEIGGQLSCWGGAFDNATLNPSAADDTSGLQWAAQALNLADARVRGTVFLGPTAPPGEHKLTIRGSVELQGARFVDLVDHPDSWPPETVPGPDGTPLICVIALDGLTYERLSGSGKYDARTRKRWLARQSHKHRVTEFRPQPYEQLVKVLREMGHEKDARAIAKARQAAWRWAGLSGIWSEWPTVRKKPRRLVSIPLRTLWRLGEWAIVGGLAGYGYGKKRLIALALVIGLLCAQIYDKAAQVGLMAPSSPVVFTNETLRSRCEKDWTSCASLPREHTSFSPHLYSFDVLLPVISLGIDSTWSPVYEEPNADRGSSGSGLEFELPLVAMPFTGGDRTLDMPHWFLRFVQWAEIIAGWALSLLIVAVFSGIMKKD